MNNFNAILVMTLKLWNISKLSFFMRHQLCKFLTIFTVEVSKRKQTLIATKIKMNLCINHVRVRGSLSSKYESKCKRSATERHTKKCSSFYTHSKWVQLKINRYKMQIKLISKHIHIYMLCVFHFNWMQLSYTWIHAINLTFIVTIT